MLDLNFTKDPEWRRQREEQWAKERDFLKDEFKKKELEVYQRYFIDGELTTYKDFTVNDVFKILYFPLKTPEAWEYIMQNLMEGRVNPRDPEGYNGFLLGMLITVSQRMDRTAWTHEEQCTLFSWLLGDTFERELTTKVPIGPRQRRPVHILNPTRVFMSAISPVYFWLKDAELDYEPVWTNKLDYLMSLIPLVDERVFDVELHDRSVRTKEGKVIVDTQRRLQHILSWMKDYVPDEKPKGSIDNHKRFLADFKQRIEALEPKPGQLATLLKQLAN